ncbi:hypothetical protein ACFLVC_04165, partial [Chloroflexota bacterium]
MNWISLIIAILLFLFNIGLIILAVYYWPKFDRLIVFPEAEDNLKIGRVRQAIYKISYKVSTKQLKIFSYALIVLVAMHVLNAPLYVIYLIL